MMHSRRRGLLHGQEQKKETSTGEDLGPPSNTWAIEALRSADS